MLVGGVGQLYQGDLDVGRVLVELLSTVDLGGGVAVEDLHYGAVAVAQRIEDLELDALILVGAAARGRPPASVERRRIERVDRPADQLQAAVGDAVTGYVGIDLVVDVAQALGVLPPRTVAIEVEPAAACPSVALSSEVEATLHQLVALVTDEVRRVPVMELDRTDSVASRASSLRMRGARTSSRAPVVMQPGDACEDREPGLIP